MNIFSELVDLYDERAANADWPAPDQTRESICGVVILRRDGSIASIRSLQVEIETGRPDAKGKRKTYLRNRRMNVPSAVGRTSGIDPNYFWDSTKYVFGVEGKSGSGKVPVPVTSLKARKSNDAFIAKHLDLLESSSHPDLLSFRAFLESWHPDQLDDFPEIIPLLDGNFVFRVEEGKFLHDLPEAMELSGRISDIHGTCLVTGKYGPIARTHPMIKGVKDAQPSGAHFTSFQLLSSRSYGKEQGENAPISDIASRKISLTLNTLLPKESGNSIDIGDTTTVFWCRSGSDSSESASESALKLFIEGGVDTASEQVRLAGALAALSRGQPAEEAGLDPDTRVCILGISANSSRLGVRFWEADNLGAIAARIARFHADCRVEPNPFKRKDGSIEVPRPQDLLLDVAPLRDATRIPALLGGALMRSILTGGRLPGSLLEAIIGRLRVEGAPDVRKRKDEGNVDGRRAAMLRAVLVRNHSMEVPVALDEENTDMAYLLGRLFAAYCYAENSYQARGSGLRQKYMGSAMATPARIFPVLQRGYINNHSGLIRSGGSKEAFGRRADRTVSRIISMMSSSPMPTTMRLPQQGLFSIGFYHQQEDFFRKRDPEPKTDDDLILNEDD